MLTAWMAGASTAMTRGGGRATTLGQVAREAREREAFQEIDVKQMFGHTAKWAAEISDPRRIPEMVSHAFHTAMNGRPGPVVLALPEDMVVERCETVERRPPVAGAALPVAVDAW